MLRLLMHRRQKREVRYTHINDIRAGFLQKCRDEVFVKGASCCVDLTIIGVQQAQSNGISREQEVIHDTIAEAEAICTAWALVIP